MTRKGNSLPIVFVPDHGSIAMSVLAMQRGAVDFLTKPVTKDDLVGVTAALRLDAEGRRAKRLLQELRRRYETLTPRERGVLRLVTIGKLNKQIAEVLGNCERTVKAHRAHIMEKLQVTSIACLAHFAVQLGSDLEVEEAPGARSSSRVAA